MKYARVELERRFVLREVPSGTPSRVARIADRYLDGTRLRLRAMTVRDATTYKLTQKKDGSITTIYLEEGEHARLSVLPGASLTKTRLSFPPFGVDVFDAPREGLLLAEVEFEDEASMRAFVPPPWREVTDDERFTGGRIVRAEMPEIATWLASPRAPRSLP